MNRLYAPWRSHYFKKVERTTFKEPCPFCAIAATKDDEKHFVLARFKHAFIMLNHYPYNAGHLLILPYAHVESLERLALDARTDLMELITLSTRILHNTLESPGINIGINLGGKVAGGSIPDHLHIHVLPRFAGDTNFLPLLANTKQISLDLVEVYQKLKRAFEQEMAVAPLQA